MVGLRPGDAWAREGERSQPPKWIVLLLCPHVWSHNDCNHCPHGTSWSSLGTLGPWVHLQADAIVGEYARGVNCAKTTPAQTRLFKVLFCPLIGAPPPPLGSNRPPWVQTPPLPHFQVIFSFSSAWAIFDEIKSFGAFGTQNCWHSVGSLPPRGRVPWKVGPPRQSGAELLKAPKKNSGLN